MSNTDNKVSHTTKDEEGSETPTPSRTMALLDTRMHSTFPSALDGTNIESSYGDFHNNPVFPHNRISAMESDEVLLGKRTPTTMPGAPSIEQENEQQESRNSFTSSSLPRLPNFQRQSQQQQNVTNPFDSSINLSSQLPGNASTARAVQTNQDVHPHLYQLDSQSYNPNSSSAASIGMFPNYRAGANSVSGRGINVAMMPTSHHQHYLLGGLMGNYQDIWTPNSSQLMNASGTLPLTGTSDHVPITMGYTAQGNSAPYMMNSISPQQTGAVVFTVPSIANVAQSRPGRHLATALNREESALTSAAPTIMPPEQMMFATQSMPQNYLAPSGQLAPPRNTNDLSALRVPASYQGFQGNAPDRESALRHQQYNIQGSSDLEAATKRKLSNPAVFPTIPFVSNNSTFAAIAAMHNSEAESSLRSARKPKTKRRRRVVKRFEERLEDLLAFKERFGHCDVPHKWKEDLSLGKWCSNVRISYKHLCKGLKPAIGLKTEQVEKLNDIGFKWSVKKTFKSFEMNFKDLMKFKEKHGHCDVPWDYKEDPSLGAWCCGVRKGYSQIQEGKSYASINKYLQLTEERVKMLDDVGFSWVLPS